MQVTVFLHFPPYIPPKHRHHRGNVTWVRGGGLELPQTDGKSVPGMPACALGKKVKSFGGCEVHSARTFVTTAGEERNDSK